MPEVVGLTVHTHTMIIFRKIHTVWYLPAKRKMSSLPPPCANRSAEPLAMAHDEGVTLVRCHFLLCLLLDALPTALLREHKEGEREAANSARLRVI